MPDYHTKQFEISKATQTSQGEYAWNGTKAKRVVIIGGTSGMGLATAKMLLDGGARVLVTGRSQAGLESAQKELGKDALVVSSDARSLTEIDALASRVKAEFDTFDPPSLGKR